MRCKTGGNAFLRSGTRVVRGYFGFSGSPGTVFR